MAAKNLLRLERFYLHNWSKRYASSKRVKEFETPQWRKLMYNADGSMKNYYDILGIEPSATYAGIKRAYYHLNKLLHPDSRISTDQQQLGMDDGKALIKLREAHEAYHVLKSRKRRAEYDSERKRIAYLDNINDVEELVHSDFEKDRKLHDKVREIQYANFKRWRQENRDPHSFIELTHKKVVFNRKIAHEHEISAKESVDLKVRRQRTLDYKLWKQKINQKQSAFHINGNPQKVDVNLAQKMEANKSNKGSYDKIDNESMADIEHMDMTRNVNQYKPDNYDENISALSADKGPRIKIEHNVNITPGIGDVHTDIVGDISSNPDTHKHHRNAMRQQLYEQWKQKQEENKYKVHREPLKIAGKVDENAKPINWYESVGSDYVDTMKYDPATEMKGVGTVKATKSYDAFNFNVDPKQQSNAFNNYSSNFDSSTIGSNMIIGHVGAVCAVLFVFISWRGAKVQ